MQSGNVQSVSHDGKLDHLLIYLTDYIQQHGFEGDGGWYFRKTWMGESYSTFLESRGLVEKVGNTTDLRTLGIRIPKQYSRQGYGRVLFLRVCNRELNRMISERANGKITE